MFDVDEKNQRTFGELAEKYETPVFKELKSYEKNRCYLNQRRAFFGNYKPNEVTPALLEKSYSEHSTKLVQSRKDVVRESA